MSRTEFVGHAGAVQHYIDMAVASRDQTELQDLLALAKRRLAFAVKTATLPESGTDAADPEEGRPAPP